MLDSENYGIGILLSDILPEMLYWLSLSSISSTGLAPLFIVMNYSSSVMSVVKFHRLLFRMSRRSNAFLSSAKIMSIFL